MSSISSDSNEQREFGRLTASEGRARTGSSRLAVPHKLDGFTDTVLMVRPAHFGFNEEAAENNTFMHADFWARQDAADVAERARAEFDGAVRALRAAGVRVVVEHDTDKPCKPDAVFPNNWFSTHADGTIVTYPMFAACRRTERSQTFVGNLQQRFGLVRRVQLDKHELDNHFLESTGSMVLDRGKRICYACNSERTTPALLDRWCRARGYRAVRFDSVDRDGLPIYHTNVMMAVGPQFVIICLASIKDEEQKRMVQDTIAQSRKQVIDLSMDEMANFAGNMLVVLSAGDGDRRTPHLVMSKRAHEALRDETIAQIKQYVQTIVVDVSMIENVGGGGIRCMLAEVFYPRCNKRAAVYVPNEILPLRRVVVHRPDAGLERFAPHRAEELLFDDIVYVPDMRREHKIFCDVLRAFVGHENVHEAEDLLADALANAGALSRERLLDDVCRIEQSSHAERLLLDKLPDKALLEVLVTGYHEADSRKFFDPIPNFIFSRDWAVVVNEYVIITKAAREARAREHYLARLIFESHPRFQHLAKQGRLINVDHFSDAAAAELERDLKIASDIPVSIEGGDIMMLHEDYLLVGSSERTSDIAIKLLAERLFERKVVRNVVRINIPSVRSSMHIDTLFTMISAEHMAAYGPIVRGENSDVQVYRDDGTEKRYSSVYKFLVAEINPVMKMIFCGNGISPFQEREQWTDGCNLVALRPGVALTYDRNKHTEVAFQEAGFTILPARQLLDGLVDGSINIDDIEMTIITLPSSELSRGRGGSHCLTLPLLRY